MTTVSEFVVKPGERIPFVLTRFPSHESAAEQRSIPEQALERHLVILGRLVGLRQRSL